MENLKLISYTVEYKNELREQNILAIFKHNGYYFSIRVFNLENIEFAFYEKLQDIDNSSYKEKFILSVFNIQNWDSIYTINENIDNDSLIIKNYDFIYDIIHKVKPYMPIILNLYNQFFN